MVLNWRVLSLLTKTDLTTYKCETNTVCVELINTRFPFQMTPVIKEFVVATEDGNVVRLRSVSFLRLRLLAKMEKSQVISPAASSQTRPPAVRAMMVFIAG